MLPVHGKELLPDIFEPLSTRVAPAWADRVPYSVGAVHTAVELTFSFGIASLQITPTFQIGTLQLRPISDIVTMRFSRSQQPRGGNLQPTFEIAKVQPTAGGFGILRLAPSQRERPSIAGPVNVPVAGLQVVSTPEAASIQVTPAQQASVLVTAGFKIASVELSPSFELASMLLSSTEREVIVQLPRVQSAQDVVRCEIAHVQLGSSGKIGMLQLNVVVEPSTRSPQVYNRTRIEIERLEEALF